MKAKKKLRKQLVNEIFHNSTTSTPTKKSNFKLYERIANPKINKTKDKKDENYTPEYIKINLHKIPNDEPVDNFAKESNHSIDENIKNIIISDEDIKNIVKSYYMKYHPTTTSNAATIEMSYDTTSDEEIMKKIHEVEDRAYGF